MIFVKKQIKTGKNSNGVLLYWMFDHKKFVRGILDIIARIS